MSKKEDRFNELKRNVEFGIGSINKNLIGLIELIEKYRKENLELIKKLKESEDKEK